MKATNVSKDDPSRYTVGVSEKHAVWAEFVAKGIALERELRGYRWRQIVADYEAEIIGRARRVMIDAEAGANIDDGGE